MLINVIKSKYSGTVLQLEVDDFGNPITLVPKGSGGDTCYEIIPGSAARVNDYGINEILTDYDRRYIRIEDALPISEPAYERYLRMAVV